MKRLLCLLFRHQLKKPLVSKRGSGVFTTCRRCGQFMIRDYYDGWQPATPREEAYYLKLYASEVARAAEVVEQGPPLEHDEPPKSLF